MLKAKNISKSLGLCRIDGLSFEINANSRLGVFGKNGSGKTTLSRILLGLEKQDSGEIELEKAGRNIKISTVFQENRLLEALSIMDNLRLVSKKSRQELTRLLEKLELENPDERVFRLSGGMKRRVAIARALAYDNFELLILDEALTGLDIGLRDRVISAILEATAEKALLIISHDEEDFQKFGVENIIRL